MKKNFEFFAEQIAPKFDHLEEKLTALAREKNIPIAAAVPSC
jgi:hypothetical protein